jgi:ribonuclease HI
MALQLVHVFTDGSVYPNPGVGGWAALLRYGKNEREISGAWPWTTNNRMQLKAVISALQALKRSCKVEVFCDSEYVTNGYSHLENWRKNNWLTYSATEVKNRDLWVELEDACKPHHVTITWIRGHNGNPDNERVDRLANSAREAFSE